MGDVREDPRYIAVEADVRSELVMPLVFKGRVVGVFDLESRELNRFTHEHIKVLRRAQEVKTTGETKQRSPSAGTARGDPRGQPARRAGLARRSTLRAGKRRACSAQLGLCRLAGPALGRGSRFGPIRMRRYHKTRRLGIAQSRVSDLVRGKWEKFSLEMLITLEARRGRTVRVELAA